MTTTASPPPWAPALPSSTGLSGLTDLDADRIADALDAARTPSTQALYARQWSLWERWCGARGLTALPGDPAAVCAFLAERAASGIAVVSLKRCPLGHRPRPPQARAG